MKLFKRQSKSLDLGLPPEVQAYSQAERRERMGMAWLVGIVSLIVSLLILTALYFGGVWLYRKATGNDKTNTDTSQPVKEDKPSDSDQDKPKVTPAPAPAPSAQTPSISDGGAQTDTPVQAPATQPATGDDSESLVRTGPDEDL